MTTRVCYLDLETTPNYRAEAEFQSSTEAHSFAVALVCDALASNVWAEVRVDHGEFGTKHQVDLVRTGVGFDLKPYVHEARTYVVDFDGYPAPS